MDEIKNSTASAGTAVAQGASNEKADEIIFRLERLPFLPFHRRLVGILGVGTFFDAFDSLAISVTAVALVSTFHLTGPASTLFTSAVIGLSFFGQGLGALLFGALSEVFGRKSMFIWSMGLFGAFSICAALAWNVPFLLLFRFLQGFGIGAEVPIAATIFNEYLRGKNRGRIGMLYETLYSWGTFLTPILALIIFALSGGPTLGWRVLYLLGGIPLIWAFIARTRLPESTRWLVEKRRLPEAERIVSTMEEEAQKQNILIESTEAMPKSYHADIQRTRFGELFSRQYINRTILTWVQWFTAFFVATGFSNWLPTFYIRIGHLNQTQSLLLTLVNGGAQLIVLYVVAFTWDRTGRKGWFVGGYALSVASAVIGALLVGVFHVLAWPVIATFGVLTALGVFISVSGLYVYTNELYPTRMRSWSISTGRGVHCFASTLAPFAVGWLLTNGPGITGIFVMFAIVALVGLVVVMFLGIETKQRVLEELAA